MNGAAMQIAATSSPPNKIRFPFRRGVGVSAFGELMKTGRALVATGGGELGVWGGGGLGLTATYAAPQFPQNLSFPCN